MVKKRLFDKLGIVKLKKGGGKKMLSFLALVLICVTLGSFGQIYIKKGLNEMGGLKFSEIFSTKVFTTLFNRYVFLGLALYGFASILWLVVLSMGDVSFVYPFISLGYVLTAFLAIFFFNENVSMTRWLAILIIVSGVFLLMRS